MPPVLPQWPATLFEGGGDDGVSEGDAALRRIRAQCLFWPAPRRAASTPLVAAIGAPALAAARAAHDDADILCVAPEDLAAIAPDRLHAVYADGGSRALVWAVMGGLRAVAIGRDRRRAVPRLVSQSFGRCPWTDARLSVEDALEAQHFLRSAAMRVPGRVSLVGMSPWKRRGVAPFLTGPDGAPRRSATVERARRRGDVVATWGAADSGGDLRIEDGFLRSVGLGVRHAYPASLTIHAGNPHFDATAPNAFDHVAGTSHLPPALLQRAARLREEIARLGVTKYNVGEAVAPPRTDRPRILVAGQVGTDASILLGARRVRTDAELLTAARARFPEGFIVYKPHPDVVAGMRHGRAADPAALRHADHVETRASAQSCLDWVDRVVTITSLMGFEALLREKAVTTFGRPFYAGWGLTDDVDPPRRPRTLSLDELMAIALLLYPVYIDPDSRLPAPPEITVRALARRRAAEGRLPARAAGAWRAIVSSILNRL